MYKWQAVSILVLAAILRVFVAGEALSSYRTWPHVEASIAAANSEFAVKLYTRLRNQTANIFFSPQSITAVLGMLLAGAGGKTEEELIEGMGLQSLSSGDEHQEKIQNGMHFLFSSQCCRENATFNTFNSLLVDKNFKVQNGFIRTIFSHYGARVLLGADFKNDQSEIVEEVNGLIRNLTRGKIPELLSDGDVSAETLMVLLNAIYFKSNWLTLFDPEMTTNKTFTTIIGKEVLVPTMFKKLKTSHTLIKELGADAIWLPFAENTVSMVILTPNQEQSPQRNWAFAEMERKLSKHKRDIHHIINKYEASNVQDIEIFIPKFQIGSKVDLTKKLAALGIKDAFTKRADFAGISSRALYVSRMIHQARFEVNEEGAEAAAATATILNRSNVADVTRYVLDKPFVFIIFDKTTNSIVFMGRLGDPSRGQ